MNMSSSEKKKHKKLKKSKKSETMCKTDSSSSVANCPDETLISDDGKLMNSVIEIETESVNRLDSSPMSTKKNKKKKKKDNCESPQTESMSLLKVSDEELTGQIKRDNDYFMSVINMIPPQFYFDEDTQDHILEMRASAGMKEGKKGKKRFSLDVTASSGAVKRARFHPDLNQTWQQMTDHFNQVSSMKDVRSSVRHPAERGATDHLQEVRQKLHQKLEELKKQRLGGSLSKGLYMSEKTKLKRRENKLKRKMKLKLEKKHKTVPDSKVNGDLTVKPTKPIFNKDGKLVFSKFDFTDISDKQNDKPKSEFTGKNYQKLLAKVEKRNEKLKKLKEKNLKEGENMEEKVKWQSALQRAQGVKVKDNPEMLKKALKSKEKQKQDRQKKWETRKERTDKMMAERQQKRQKNIKAQKLKNMDKKVQKLKKKGRLIPGF